MGEERERVGLGSGGEVVSYMRGGGEYYGEGEIERGDEGEVDMWVVGERGFWDENEKCRG